MTKINQRYATRDMNELVRKASLHVQFIAHDISFTDGADRVAR